MRKRHYLLLSLSILALFAATIKFQSVNAQAGAVSEIAMELASETVLIESNADQRLPMASTTKIMTALIIVEDCDLDEVITVPDAAVGVEGSSIYLKKDEQIDVRDLVYGLMLRSGNDSAAALAIHHSGSIDNFVKVMNERANRIGAKNTNFKNPSGLPDDEHYTTARDLCAIACRAMKNETFKQIVSSKSYSGKFRSFENKNKMLRNYDGANGVKTGYTVKAGRCLVSSAERNGMDVVTVVLNCYDMYERSSQLLDKCFSDYKVLNLDENSIFMSDKVLCKLLKSERIIVKSIENLSFKVIPCENGKKLKAGDYAGKLEIYNQNNLIFQADLYSIMSTEN